MEWLRREESGVAGHSMVSSVQSVDRKGEKRELARWREREDPALRSQNR